MVGENYKNIDGHYMHVTWVCMHMCIFWCLGIKAWPTDCDRSHFHCMVELVVVFVVNFTMNKMRFRVDYIRAWGLSVRLFAALFIEWFDLLNTVLYLAQTTVWLNKL